MQPTRTNSPGVDCHAYPVSLGVACFTNREKRRCAPAQPMGKVQTIRPLSRRRPFPYRPTQGLPSFGGNRFECREVGT